MPSHAVYTARFPWATLAAGVVLLGAAAAVFIGTGAMVAGEVLLLAAFFAVGRILYSFRAAARVEITTAALVARPSVGRTVQVPWGSVTELLHSPSPAHPRRVRVIANRHTVVLTRDLAPFTELCDELRARAPQAAVTSSTILRR